MRSTRTTRPDARYSTSARPSDDGLYIVQTSTDDQGRRGSIVYWSLWELERNEASEKARLDERMRTGTSKEILAEIRKGAIVPRPERFLERTIITRPVKFLGPLETRVGNALAWVLSNHANDRSSPPPGQLTDEVCAYLDQREGVKLRLRQRRRRGVVAAVRIFCAPAAGRGSRPRADRDLAKALYRANVRERREARKAKHLPRRRGQLSSVELTARQIGIHRSRMEALLGWNRRRDKANS